MNEDEIDSEWERIFSDAQKQLNDKEKRVESFNLLSLIGSRDEVGSIDERSRSYVSDPPPPSSQLSETASTTSPTQFQRQTASTLNVPLLFNEPPLQDLRKESFVSSTCSKALATKSDNNIDDRRRPLLIEGLSLSHSYIQKEEIHPSGGDSDSDARYGGGGGGENVHGTDDKKTVSFKLTYGESDYVLEESSVHSDTKGNSNNEEEKHRKKKNHKKRKKKRHLERKHSFDLLSDDKRVRNGFELFESSLNESQQSGRLTSEHSTDKHLFALRCPRISIHRRHSTVGTMGIKKSASVGYNIKHFDHSPHELFVEMEELRGKEWVETARWIKYEEDREEGAERWGKAHISSLSFHSLINLRICIEKSTMILDMEASNFKEVVGQIIQSLPKLSNLTEHMKQEIQRVLLYKHKHVDEKSGFRLISLKRNVSGVSLMLNSDEMKLKIKRSKLTKASTFATMHPEMLPSPDVNSGQGIESGKENNLPAAFNGGGRSKESLLRCMESGTEGVVTLVGSLEALTEPLTVFVRMAEAIYMPSAIEVTLPVRFVFVFFTPEPCLNVDYHEVGRAFSTLMSNRNFHNVCYDIDDRSELLSAINVFLDDSIVLPPGDWSNNNLFGMEEIRDIRRRQKERGQKKAEMLIANKEASKLMGKKNLDHPVNSSFQTNIEAGVSFDVLPDTKEAFSLASVRRRGIQGLSFDDGDDEKNDAIKRTHYKEFGDPLKRVSGVPFGGVLNDFKRRMPWFLSDFKDGLNGQTVAAAMFIYFAALSGAIAFGGLTGEITDNLIGITETLLISAVSGCVFALFAGQPLIIIGTTGPVLLYDEALLNFTKGGLVEFLPWRIWIACWTTIIAIVVAGFQGSTLVKYFTKFTKDIFAALVSLLFVVEAFKKLYYIFDEHPLVSLEFYCNTRYFSENVDGPGLLHQTRSLKNGTNSPLGETLQVPLLNNTNNSSNKRNSVLAEPNTALLSSILMLGTFFVAYFLRILRNSHYFGRTFRRALGDFGVPISIVTMVLLDYLINDTYTQKLKVPDGLQVTDPSQRSWLIPPTGLTRDIPIWAPFAAVIPAMLLYLLLFMETHICELIMLEKSDRKGGGVHWDIVLLCFLNFIAALFGGPWICAATVRSVAHVSALTVMSTTHAPGESPKVVEVKDQRVSPFLVSISVGFSVLLAPILKIVPISVLFGVFLYMGVSSMNGIQLFQRITLFIVPVKHHPSVSYVRKVKTWKMHLFTIFQTVGLIVLWIVKSTQVALAFPFFIVAMIPYRLLISYLYNKRELDAMDLMPVTQLVKMIRTSMKKVLVADSYSSIFDRYFIT